MKKYIKTIVFIVCLHIIGGTVNMLLTKTVKGKRVMDAFMNGSTCAVFE
jgi:hypothetical protein